MVIVEMPARKIPLNYRNITGYVQSSKSDNYTYFESSLERDALLLLEFDFNVKQFKTQPKRFHYKHNNKNKHYTPDIWVEYRNGSCKYIEVKYRDDLKKDWATLQPKFKAVIHQVKDEINTKFKILTEVEIRTPLLENVTYLLSYRHRGYEDYQMKTIIKVLSRSAKLNVTELLSVCTSSLEVRATFLNTLWVALANGIVKTDLNKKLTMKSHVWVIRDELVIDRETPRRYLNE